MITNLEINNIEISGRLGNNLFQIAFLVGLKEKYGYDYSIPFWRHSKDFRKVISNKDLSNASMILGEQSFNYSEVPYLGDFSKKLIDFRGYFQSWKYFSHCREFILDTFRFNSEVSEKAFKYFDSINIDPSKTCAIHVRRGDYVQKSNYHTNLLENTNYYIEALKIAKKEVDNFLVFSDDIKYCKRIFVNTGINFYFSEDNTEVEDLCIMSLCKSFIIANSSFSWWGAYLSKEPEKTVIAPKKWFEVANIDTSDLIPKEWIRI